MRKLTKQAKHLAWLFALVVASLLFVACDEQPVSPQRTKPLPAPSAAQATDGGPAEPPQSTTQSQYSPDKVQVAQRSEGEPAKNDDGNAMVDDGNAHLGYVWVSITCNRPAKARVLMNGQDFGQEYIYNIPNNGTWVALPLSEGDGQYMVQLMEKKVEDPKDTIYTARFKHKVDVQLDSEYAPFLVNNIYVDYTKSSEVVKLGYEVTKDAGNELEALTAIFNYVSDNIAYDYDLADDIINRVVTGYIPDIPGSMRKGKGICQDFASIMAAMLRSQNVPTKFIKGDALQSDYRVYHAWVSVYIKDAGWVTQKIQFDGKSWQMLDPTFEATGASEKEFEYNATGQY